MNDLIGRTLGPYRILEQLGMGGMATVYKAYQPAMDRYVAIKVLPPHLASDPQFHARFQREARIIAHLEHRYILPVYDVGEIDGIAFLIMRYTQGGTLGDLLAAGRLETQRAVEIVGQVGEALAHAHRKGIIHRDIKPANVLISHEGDVLLSDFGIAKMIEGTLALTAEGAWIGTPFYMAPEQVQGQPADPRTDIYALGVILYEILTGRRPYIAETPLAVALMHVHNPLPPPRQLNPAIPAALERVVLRALAKDPADRFQHADQMVAALRDLHNAPADAASEAVTVAPSGLTTVILPADSMLAPATPPPSPDAAPRSEDRPEAVARRRGPRERSGQPRWLPWAIIALVAFLIFGRRLWSDSPNTTTSGPLAPAMPSAPGIASVNQLAVLGDKVWAASDGGLVCWKSDLGHAVFRNNDDLPFESSDIQAIVAAPDGTLWLGGGGVVHLTIDEGEPDGTNYYTKDEGLGIGAVRTLLVDRDGAILAGGSASPNSISRFDGNQWQPLELPFDPTLKDFELNVRSLLRSQDGALWIGLDSGTLLQLTGSDPAAASTLKGYNLQKAREPNKDLRIRRLAEDPSGTLWAAASDRGLLRFDRAADRWDPVTVLRPGVPISEVAVIDGSLWVAGDDLVARSADGGATWEEIGGPDDVGSDIGSLVIDSSGRVWAGAYQGGVSVLDHGDWRSLQP